MSVVASTISASAASSSATSRAVKVINTKMYHTTEIRILDRTFCIEPYKAVQHFSLVNRPVIFLLKSTFSFYQATMYTYIK